MPGPIAREPIAREPIAVPVEGSLARPPQIPTDFACRSLVVSPKAAGVVRSLVFGSVAGGDGVGVELRLSSRRSPAKDECRLCYVSEPGRQFVGTPRAATGAPEPLTTVGSCVQGGRPHG